MAIDEKLFKTISLISTWSRNKVRIKRVWIYGSRLRGTQNHDSDLDIAIEIDLISTDEEAQMLWMDEKASWVSELQALSPYKIHLEMYGTPKVSEFIACCSMLIYER